MTLYVQFMTMIVMVIGGFYLGMALDTFRRFSWHWGHKPFLKYALEICFWLIQSLVLFYVLFRVNAGELRLYVFLSCLLGFAAYKALAAPVYKQILEGIIRILLAVYLFFERLVHVLIITPVKWVIKEIYMVLSWLIRIVFLILFRILQLLLYPVKALLIVIYRRLPKKLQRNLYKSAGLYSKIKKIYRKGIHYITFKRR